MLTLKWYTITEVMLICIVIVLSLPSTWEVFLILLEFVKEWFAKSLSKLLTFADFPQRYCRQDTRHEIPSCPMVIFLAPIPAIIWRDHEIVQTIKKEMFPLQNILLILTWSGIDRVKIDLIKKRMADSLQLILSRILHFA